MNPREKILLICFGGVIALFVIYGAVHGLVLAPGERYAREIQALRSKNTDLRKSNADLAHYVGDYVDLRDRTYESNRLKASVLATARINDLARQAGLSPGDVTTTAFTGGRVEPGAFQEIVFNISAGGTLEHVTNFLYLLAKDKYVHRLTNLSVSPRQGGQEVTFSLRYATVVMDEIKQKDIPPRPPPQPAEIARLSDPQRAVYDVIPRRNIFMPYVPPPPTVAQTGAGPGQPRVEVPSGPVETPAWYNSLLVTGLPSADNEPEVHVTTPGQHIKKVLKVGDDLPIGKIAMVDYRQMPRPDRPTATSTSRVILKVGQDYWAVELGQQLGQKRILKPQELPEELKIETQEEKASTQPAAKT